MVASSVPPTGDLACNPGMCPDWKLNQRPFALQAGAQSTELHQPGLESHSYGDNTNWPSMNCYHPVAIIMNDKLLHLMMFEELISPQFICICASTAGELEEKVAYF